MSATKLGFFRGLTYPFRGFSFVFFRHLGLFRIWIWPVLLTAAFLVGTLSAAWMWHEAVVEVVWESPTGSGVWPGVARALHQVTGWLAFLALAVAGFFLTLLLTPIVAAPFNSWLSEAVERLVLGTAPDPQPLGRARLAQELVWILRSIGLELLKLAIYVGATLPLWLLSFALPWIAPVTTAVGFLFTAMHTAVDFTDSPQERRHRRVLQTYSFALDHFWPMFGFGVGALFFLFVPVLNLLTLPVVVAGGTLLYLDLSGLRPAKSPPQVT